MSHEGAEQAWRTKWSEGFKCAFLLTSLKDYFVVANFNPDRTERFLDEINSLLRNDAPPAIEGLLRQFRDAHGNGDNARASRILDSIIVQIEQLP